MSSVVRHVGTCAIAQLLLLAACVGAPKRADVVPVVEAYVKQTEQLQEQERQRLLKGIVHLTVSQTGLGENYLISVELEEASLNTVIYQILDQTTVAYLFDNVTLRGRVTARFADLPLLQALNALLLPRGYSVAREDGLLVIGDVLNRPAELPAPTQATGPSPQGETSAATPAPEEASHLAVPLTYLDVESASAIVQGLYPAGANNVRLVDSAKQTETNTLYLRGPKEEVRRAALQIRRADQQPSHVVIEALVVEFDARALEQFGIDISNATHNQYSDIATAFGSLSSPALVFTRVQGAANVTAFTATIDALVGQDKARVVARPYMSTVSGKPAAINITGNIYVLSQVVEGGAAIVTPTAITSGVILNITPLVRDDEMIQVTVDVEESSFLPPPGTNVAASVNKNQANTTMLVESGQTIVIGGLALNRDSSLNSGLPWLRRVPGLNLLFGRQTRLITNQEVVVLITPHVWNPGVQPPIVRAQELGLAGSDDTLTPAERFGVEDKKD